jgi:4-azaleucine resistance transporter AzlC
MKIYHETLRFSLIKSLPIMVSYFFVSMVFGMMMGQQGWSWIYAAAASFFIYTGAFQFVFASMLSTGAPFMTILLTDLFMSSRQIFYGISHIDDFKKTGKMMPYMIHSMTDETYALYASIKEYPANVSRIKAEEYIAMFSHASWVIGTAAGTLIGNRIPSDVRGFDFALTALFLTIVIDQWKSADSHVPAVIGLLCAIGWLAALGTDYFLLPSLITASLILAAVSYCNKRVCMDE